MVSQTQNELWWWGGLNGDSVVVINTRPDPFLLGRSVFEMGSFKVEATQPTNKLNFRGLGWRERERPAEGGATLTQWRK